MAVSGAALFAAGGTAQGATVLGQTMVDPAFNDCTTGFPYTEIQRSTGAAPSYTVPAGGGVITSWSHQGGPNETGELKFKVYRPTMDPNVYTVVDSSQQTMAANTLTTTNTQIPVQAGDTLGYTRATDSHMACLFQTADAGDIVDDAPNIDTADGGNTTFNAPSPMFRINISAVLEPDIDGDGLGDESQDPDDDNDGVPDAMDNCPVNANGNQANNDGDAQGDICDPDDDNDGVADVSDNCPTVAGTSANGGCPPVATPAPLNPTTTPTTPAPAKKKCKKRKAGGAQVTRKRCKKKRK